MFICLIFFIYLLTIWGLSLRPNNEREKSGAGAKMNSKYWGCGNVCWSYISDCLVAGYAANDVPSGQPAAAAGTHLHHPIRSGYSAYCKK